MTEPFQPDEWEVQAYDDERIKLILRADTGESREAILPRSTIPGLIERLVAEIGPGQGAAISISSLRPGLTILVQGFAARRHQDGSADLVLSVHLPDEARDVTIPLALSPVDAAELSRMLSAREGQ